MSHALKFARANEHFAALDAEIDRYIFEDETQTVTTSASEDGREHVFTVTLNKEPPVEWGPMLGDVIHNLRCTLDHIVWELADPADRGTHTMFPIMADRDVFHEVTKAGRPTFRSGTRKLAGVPEAAIAVMEAAQPYHPLTGEGEWRPGAALLLLSELENIDKHRAIHTVVAVTEAIPENAPGLGPGEVAEVTVRIGPLNPVGQTTEVLRLNFPTAESAADVEVRTSFKVVFLEPPIAERRELSATLQGLIASVEQVVQTLTPYLPS